MAYTRGGHTSAGVYIYEDGEEVAVVFVQDPDEARRIARELVDGAANRPPPGVKEKP